MSKKIILACMALGAFVAFAIIPASASAVRLCETTVGGTCHDVATGVAVTAHLDGTTTSQFSGGGVTVTCSSVHMTGTVVKNNGTEVEGNLTGASFTGTSGTGTECSSGLGPVNVTTTFTPEGEGVPYCVKALPGAAMEATVRGGLCANKARGLTFVLDVTTIFGTVQCKYERSTATGPVKGEYTTDTSSQDAVVHVVFGANSEFTGESGNSGTCPPNGQLKMSLTLQTESNGETLYFKE